MSQVVALSVALGLLAAQAQPMQPRDARATTEPSGTAAIRGRVYGAESGQPVRRAIVSLMSMPPQLPPPPPSSEAQATPRGAAAVTPVRPATVVTDASGKFEFTGLAPGTYRVRVQPPPYSGQYLGGGFGAKDSMDPGRAIELKPGEQFNQVEVSLRRGGAIAGRIVDDAGEPLSRVMVFPSRVLPGTGTIQRTGGGFQTDDHGRYRIFGLEPGDYVVAAEGRGMGGPQIEGIESEGFITTYHPSILTDRDASRVRVRAASDTEGIDIQIIRTRTYRITGSIMDSQGRAVSGVHPMLVKQQGTGFSSGGPSVDQQGRFVFRDVVPGDYMLVIRPGTFGPTPPQETAKKAVEYAAMPLSVNADLENIVVVTQPGVTIAGQVVFADGPPAANPGVMRVMTQPGTRMMMMGPSPSTAVGADLQFTLSDMFGPLLIRVGLPRAFALKAIMLGSTDITDTPVDFKREHSGHLQIVVSTRPAFVEGTVTGEDGGPVEQAMVLVFPEDKESWKFGSPRVRMTVSMKEGKYTTAGLVGGRYFAIAMPPRSVGMSPETPPEFFESLARDATRLVVADDERRVVDLRISKRPE